jgi:dienelactone hydrolase
MMECKFLAQAATTGLAVVVLPSLVAGQEPPPMGGGYTNVIPIPVDDPTTKAIAGALFKPEGAGPFPAVVYMVGCGGLHYPAEAALEKSLIDHFLAKGVATLILDPFTARNEGGICYELATVNEKTLAPYGPRGGNDALAALKVLKAMPDIDSSRIFLQGYSYGASASLFASDPKTPGARDAKIAGVIAYCPYCYDKVEFSAPTLILIGERDDWTPAALCQAVKGKPNVEVVVFPGAAHGFNFDWSLWSRAEHQPPPTDWMGHDIGYDERATQDAERRADAFMDAHIK